MRQSVGNTFIFGLVMSFTLIFAGFLVLALAYSKAYKLKNEMTSMIERYEGITTSDANGNGGSYTIMNQYLRNAGYDTRGECDEGEYGVANLEGDLPVQVRQNDSTKYYYCFSYSTDHNCDTIFRLKLFYKFNLPVIGQIRNFTITGNTTEINPAFYLGTEIGC